MGKRQIALRLVGLLCSLGLALAGQSDYMKKNVRKNFGDNRLVTINSGKISDEVRRLLNTEEIDRLGHVNGELHIRTAPSVVEALKNAGAEMEDHTEEFISNMERRLQAEDFFCEDGAAVCGSAPFDEFYASYQFLDSIYVRLNLLIAAAPTFTYMESIGTSHEGRPLDTVFIGDQTKPLVFYYCNIHAREWIVPMFCTYMAEMLIADGAGHPLLEKFSFAILPSLNPDGFIYSYTVSNIWRKTRKPNPGTSCVGTDGERNFPIGFGGEGSSGSACSDLYHGASPLDQPETAAVAAFAASVQDRLFHFNDCHSYGEYWMSPWASFTELPPAADYDRMLDCMQAAHDAIQDTHGLDFSIGSIATTIYVASGGSPDYIYDEFGVIYAYALEARGGGLGGYEGFHPPKEHIILSNEELFAGMEASVLCGYENDIDPSPTESPTPGSGCEDMDPNGIMFSDGTPAPCNILKDYCPEYTFIPERCPKTCGVCKTRGPRVASTEKLEVKVIPVKPSAAVDGSNKEPAYFTVTVGIGIAVGVIGLVAAIGGFVYLVKEQRQLNKTPSVARDNKDPEKIPDDNSGELAPAPLSESL